MVGAGIFIVIGEAGSIAGNIVWVSFVIGGNECNVLFCRAYHYCSSY